MHFDCRTLGLDPRQHFAGSVDCARFENNLEPGYSHLSDTLAEQLQQSQMAVFEYCRSLAALFGAERTVPDRIDFDYFDFVFLINKKFGIFVFRIRNF